MKVTVTPAPPPPPPPRTYTIEDLTEDQILFLRDLAGRFSCTYPKGKAQHGHSELYNQLHELTSGIDTRYRFETTASSRQDVVLRCHLRNED